MSGQPDMRVRAAGADAVKRLCRIFALAGVREVGCADALSWAARSAVHLRRHADAHHTDHRRRLGRRLRVGGRCSHGSRSEGGFAGWQVFAHNWLEIAVAKGNPRRINGLADLSRAGIVVVLADPSVPAGKYAQQALARAHVTVHPASLELQVTGVLTKVQLGEADAGIVYASDIFTSNRVDGVPIAADQNVIADYPIGTLKSSSHPAAARAFLDFVLSTEGQGILKSSGFLGM
jgi:ABC-type sulfate transport system substrate-binding protein